MPRRHDPLADDLALAAFQPKPLAPILPVIGGRVSCALLVSHVTEYTVDRLFHALPARPRQQTGALKGPIGGPAEHVSGKEDLAGRAQRYDARRKDGAVDDRTVEKRGPSIDHQNAVDIPPVPRVQRRTPCEDDQQGFVGCLSATIRRDGRTQADATPSAGVTPSVVGASSEEDPAVAPAPAVDPAETSDVQPESRCHVDSRSRHSHPGARTRPEDLR